MSQRCLTFLGTASQVPTRERNHNAAFLHWDELGILFDPGEGTQRQMTLAGLTATQITHICITHFHGDHCLGLAGIIQRLSLDDVSHPVEVIFPSTGTVFFERLRYACSFYERALLVPRPVQASPGELVEVCRAGKVRLLTQGLEHSIPCQGYRLEEDDARRMLPDRLAAAGVTGPAVRRLQQQGRLEMQGRVVTLEQVSVPRPGQTFAYVMDTRACPGADALARGADLLVCEATYQQDQAADAHNNFHLTAAGAAELATRVGARRLALTHFSRRYPTVEGFHAEAAERHADVFCGEDLAHVEVPARREA